MDPGPASGLIPWMVPEIAIVTCVATPGAGGVIAVGAARYAGTRKRRPAFGIGPAPGTISVPSTSAPKTPLPPIQRLAPEPPSPRQVVLAFSIPGGLSTRPVTPVPGGGCT